MDRKWFVGVGAGILMMAGCAGQSIMRTEAELAQKSGKPLATTVSATVAKDTALRAGPDKETGVLQQIPAGTAVTASETVARGFRRVTTADGKSGFVDAAAVELGAGGGANAAPAGK
jgi:hypothetical protein